MTSTSPNGQQRLTFPQLFQENLQRYGHGKVAMREKEYGIWQSYSWADAWAAVEGMANGLAALGFQRGDRICVVGDNRPHLYWGMLAAQCLGGVPVPIYQDSIEREMTFIVQHAEARFALVEDQEQADKLIAIKEECPNLQWVVYKDPRGLRNYRQPWLRSYTALQEEGARFRDGNPGHLQAEIDQGQEEDLAVICYTSGTTGRPKGVMLTHRNFALLCQGIIPHEGMTPDESVMAYLPMAWVGDFFLSFALSTAGGFAVNCPESASTVLADVREIGPTLFFAPPRIWENLLTTVMVRMDDAAWIKRRLFHAFINLAMRVQKHRAAKQQPSAVQRLLLLMGNALVYAPLRDQLGMGRIRIAYTAGEAIGPDIFNFFRGIGINLKQLYGSTETSVFVALQPNHEARPDTCGPPLPWVELKIADNGEVLIKSPGLFKGYLKNPEATAEAFQDGYFRTGDAGILDHEGHLKIIDRVKDVSRLDGGTLFSPKYLENKLKFSPFIKEAVAIGQARPFVTAILNIDLSSVGNWAERHNISYTGYTDLAQKPEVQELIADEVVRVNASLAEDEETRPTQIRRFLILHKELDPDDEEITRTRKVRRGFVAEKYKTLIDALYSGERQVAMEVTVTFEDGRTTQIHANLDIREMGAAR